MRSNRRKVKGVGEWMVLQMVMSPDTRSFTTFITCTENNRQSGCEQ